MDAATAVMGCSPAYRRVVAETLIEGAVKEGIDPESRREMVVDTIAGTGELLRGASRRGRAQGRRPAGGLRQRG